MGDMGLANQAVSELRFSSDTPIEIQLQKFAEQRYNVLLPASGLQQENAMLQPRLEVVFIDSNPDSGDVFRAGSRPGKDNGESEGLFSLSKPALMRLSVAAGIQWNYQLCRAVADDGIRLVYEVVGGVKKPDGTFLPLKSSYEYDLQAVRDQAEDQLWSKVSKWKNKPADEKKKYVEDTLERDMLLKRRFRRQLAETGAMLRAIRMLLGLKSTYTVEQLSRPFVVPVMVFKPDMSDPVIRQEMVRQQFAAMSQIYGQQNQFSQPAIEAEVAKQGADDAAAFAELNQAETASTPITDEEMPFDEKSPVDQDWELFLGLENGTQMNFFMRCNLDMKAEFVKRMADRLKIDTQTWKIKSPWDWEERFLVAYMSKLLGDSK